MLSSCFKLIPPSVKQLYPAALAKQHDPKIKDLETGCGVSVGYLSRLRQGEKNIAPGADFLLAVSERLSVSVDMLLSSEISEATESENEMLQYIDKLTRETCSRIILSIQCKRTEQNNPEQLLFIFTYRKLPFCFSCHHFQDMVFFYCIKLA